VSYGIDPLEFTGLRTISLADRGGKVRASDFARPYTAGAGFRGWLDYLPRILAADDLRAAARAIADALTKGKPVIWGMGGHVIKCGMTPILIDLMRRGYATAFAMNGSASIHDFEIGLAGHTSEDVESALPDGRFGSAEETGREWNKAIQQGMGIGESLGRSLETLAPARYQEFSLLLQAWKARVPVTVHVAVGTDTPHAHPAVNPELLGAATHRDFRLFCGLAAQLDSGGVYINAGSAVVMPEVFLKAVSTVRNLGHTLAGFTTINLDFLQHYRPRVNVVERPHAHAGGRGIALTGHHEIMIPLLAALLIEAQVAEK
jgi:hypothetical protein